MKWLRRQVLPFTLRLSEVRLDHLDLAGGKAGSLAQLLQAGLPVPDGFVVSTEAFRRFSDDTGRLDSAALLSQNDQISQSLRTRPIPEAIRAAVRARLREFPHVNAWAVRSSAVAEDSAAHSFAGQHDSFLNVPTEELLERIRDCWLSLFSARSLSYRALNQINACPAMAVILQQMVPADVAGVLFTADPLSGRADRIVIEAGPGLGDKIVSGETAPERVVLARPSGAVVSAMAADPGAAEDRAGGCLDPVMARRLAELGQAAEAVLTGPLDIEWAACGGRLYLLQARPITGLVVSERDGKRRVWTNMNTGEVMPDVITPMSWSLLQIFLQPLFQSVFRLVGADSSRHPVVELVAGRVYFNANVGLAALKPFLVIVQRIPKFAEALGGARINGDPQTLLKVMSVPDLGFRWLKYLLSWPRLLPLILAHSPRRGEAWIKRVKARNDQLTRTSFEAMATAELERFFSRAVRESFEGWDLLYLGTQAIALPLFDRLCRTWLNDPDLAVGYRLFGGLGGIPEAEAGVALWNLSTLAHSDPYIERLIRSAPSWDQAQRQLERTQPGRKLLKAWAAFMTEHGHHCRSELELANPRWAETPDYILSVVRSYLDAIGQCSPPEAQARLAAQRRQLTADCTQRLADPLRQWIFSQTLARTQKAAVAREIWKNEVVRVMAFLRRVLLLLGARLHADGSLADPQDIFFLTASELEPVCAGNLAADYRTLIQKRRREYSRNQQLHPPPLVVDHFDAEAQGSESPAPDGNVLTGIPVSPGMVAGPARVILRNSHHEQVLPGEILVAPFTDPAWTPYFVPAAALVTDLGGILSHGSIVAREYGIPAVTNVGCATRAIATGDWVEVDGTRGRVTILKRLRPT